MLSGAAAYASKPWRRLHPVLFWTQWGDNMSLYGYGRPTTPGLQAQQAVLGEAFTAFRQAWSADATTLPALRNFFRFGEPDAAHPHHALGIARAAGYIVWYRTPGRSGASLDSEVLDCLEEALADPAPRKLLVLHLMGAHPHYDLCFPEGANPFDDRPDAVDAMLERAGRPAWLRDRREKYDAAVLYHEGIVSTILRRTREGGTPGGYRAFMYLSDHGQEVGHGANWAGHSPSTPAGYRIPAIVWHNGPCAAGCAGGWTVARCARTGRAIRWCSCCASTGRAIGPTATCSAEATGGIRRKWRPWRKHVARRQGPGRPRIDDRPEGSGGRVGPPPTAAGAMRA
ncbi:Sulfatase [Paracidovorax cattleyae]|uniref:Sulfatase n=1 Tax=Paracidovorax cattleyae TaxID=80868 RepID=A0A1H0PE41_9BURK|nr:sulfatase-like hydrolase/transferase [Paracidovorax cattleyae]SDP02909.1 Sulfatase [Paracidovorax cattleyae]